MLDYRLLVGGTYGSLDVQPSQDFPFQRQFEYQSIAFVPGLVFQPHFDFFYLLDIPIQFDYTNNQVINIGGSIGVGYHLLGGIKEYQTGSEDLSLTFTNEYSLSGVVKMSYLFFDAGTSETLSQLSSVKSSVLTLDVGLLYRHDIVDQWSTGVELNASVLSFAVDNETKVSVFQFIFGGFVRF